MKNIALLFLFLSSCCFPTKGPPGDASSLAWKPPEVEYEENVIDCNGEARGRFNIKETGTVIRNCTIHGDVRIFGIARNANSNALRELSRTADYVTTLRNKSPSHIVIEDSKIIGSGTVPLYVGPGVTFVTIKNVTISGYSRSTMVYLGAESSRITIENSLIDATKADREAIAIDSSDHNVIKGNTIFMGEHGGIFTYRNCGENKTIRHTTPSYSHIIENEFKGGGTAIFLGSRNGNRCYCDLDDGFPFGSSASDLDHSRFNLVKDNNLNGAKIKIGSAYSNIVQESK